MIQFTISATDCRSIASLIHFTDKGHPSMDVIHVKIADNTLTAMATDRYKIGTWVTDNLDLPSNDLIEFSITADMAKWLSAIKLPKGARGHGIQFELDDSTLTARYGGNLFASEFRLHSEIRDKVLGYMPTDVAPEQPCAPFCLSTSHLIDISKVVDRDGKKVERLEFRETARTNGKPAPFLITAQGCPEFKALLQPAMIR